MKVFLFFQTSCKGQKVCYCPSVGDCEDFLYEVTFPNLHISNTHEGDHHRDYYLTITITNMVSLSTTVTFDLLLDESPPSKGVVWEGLSIDGQAEMDFTSHDEVHVQWHGYEDHESGLRLYRVVMANRYFIICKIFSIESHYVLSAKRFLKFINKSLSYNILNIAIEFFVKF